MGIKHTTMKLASNVLIGVLIALLTVSFAIAMVMHESRLSKIEALISKPVLPVKAASQLSDNVGGYFPAQFGEQMRQARIEEFPPQF